MEKEKQAETIEIMEPVKVEAKPLPTKDELREKGFTAMELESAEKHGMVAKEKTDEEKEKAKKEEVVKLDTKTEEEKAADLKIEAEKEKFKHSQQFRDAELTSDQETKLRDMFPFVNGKMNPVEAIYHRMKNERKARQKAEADNKALQDELKASKTAKPKIVEEEPELDADGNPIDPEDKPLTAKRLKEMREQEEKEAEEKQKALREKGTAVVESLRDQEDYAKGIYPDFDNTVKLAAELMQNLDELVPDAKSRNKVIGLIRDLQVKAARADELSMEDFNAADISYEIGKMHPKYGKEKEIDPKANGSQRAEKVKRVEETTQRRSSSAGLNDGGGKRIVSPEEVTRDDLAKMDYKQRASFKKNHPDRYSSLLWG